MERGRGEEPTEGRGVVLNRTLDGRADEDAAGEAAEDEAAGGGAVEEAADAAGGGAVDEAADAAVRVLRLPLTRS